MNPTNDHNRAWMDEMAKQGAPKTEKERKIAQKVEEIEGRVGKVLEESRVDGSRFIIETTNTKGDITSQKLDHKEFAEWLVNESGEHFITIRGDDDVYMYEDGVYIEHGESFIKSMLYKVMDGICVTRNGESEVLSHVRAMTYSDRSVFDGNEDIINMDNGLYIFSTGMFIDHTPEYKTLIKSAVKYDPDAICPAIDTFFRETATPDRVQTLYEIAGYAIIPKKEYKRGFILLGKSDTGKSQYLKVLRVFVGAGMTSTVTPHAIAINSHATASLYGKLLNLVDDMSGAVIIDTSVIKSIVGINPIECNQKNKEAFTFIPQAVNVWSCNTLPKVDDDHFGDKFDILYMNNVYGGHKKPEQQLLDKITTEAEMSGLFNKAVEAFRGVKERGEFTGSLSSKGRNINWEEKSRPIAEFCNTRCRLVDKALVLKDGFYKSYVRFCYEIGAKRESKNTVKTYLENTHAVFEKKDRVGTYENPRWCYLGIEIVSNTEIVPKHEMELEHPFSAAGEATVPIVPTITPILKPIEEENIVYNKKMGTKPGTNGTKAATESEKTTTEKWNNNGTKLQQSKRVDLDQSTYPDLWADPNAEQKLKHAVGKAIAKTNRPDVDAVMINEAHAEHPGVSMVVAQLNDRGDALGITWNAKGLYRITI